MSFQDFGTSRPSNPSAGGGGASVGGLAAGGGEGMNGGAGGPVGEGYGQVSDGILQYQRNVGILERIINNMGTTNNTTIVENQYNVQVDVIRQLGTKIENQLKHKEQLLSTMTRTEASRSRATHTKLSRDYRRVENTFKNLQLESKRKRTAAENRLRLQEEEESRRQFEEGIGYDTEKLQTQLKEDRINEEIMREREEEIRNINQGMKTVNEIYKDLAHIVDSQQEQVDEVENHMESANKNAESGLKQIEKANAKMDDTSCIIC